MAKLTLTLDSWLKLNRITAPLTVHIYVQYETYLQSAPVLCCTYKEFIIWQGRKNSSYWLERLYKVSNRIKTKKPEVKTIQILTASYRRNPHLDTRLGPQLKLLP